MTSRRSFIKKSLFLTAGGLFADAGLSPAASAMEPPPDIFDAEVLDMEFWVKPRVIEVVRPASGERARLLYWKDGEVIESAYQQLCHLLRDVNGGGKTAPMDHNLLETLWGTQRIKREGSHKLQRLCAAWVCLRFRI